MPDIQLRQRFPAAPDLSFGPDRAEYDLWHREQFPRRPDLSHYPVRWGIQQPATGVPNRTLTIGASEGADVAAFALKRGHPLTIGATESADVAAFALKRGHPLAIAANESADIAAFAAAIQGLPNRGPFQCGLFQPNLFQNDCAVPDAGGWRGHGGRWDSPRGNDDILHQAFAKGLAPPVARAIERTVRDATADEARAVLEAQIDRAGEAWDERFYALLQEMQRRDMETLRELIAWQAMMIADDEDAIAVVMMLH